MFFADYGTYFLKVHLIFKDKKSSVEIKVFLLFLLHEVRIRFCKNNDGSGSKKPKNQWILRIRIRIHNTAFPFRLLAKFSTIWGLQVYWLSELYKAGTG